MEYLPLLLLFNIVLEDLTNVLNHEGEMTATTVGKEKIRILFEYDIVVYQKKKKKKIIHQKLLYLIILINEYINKIEYSQVAEYKRKCKHQWLFLVSIVRRQEKKKDAAFV